MGWERGGGSGERRPGLCRSRRAGPCFADLFQVPLKGPHARENAAVHCVEFIVRCVENEAARNADGNSDGAVVILNRKTLHGHRTLLPANNRARGLAARASARVE